MKRFALSAAILAAAVVGISEGAAAGQFGLFSGGSYGSAVASYGSYGSGGSYGSTGASHGSYGSASSHGSTGSTGSSGSSGGLTAREARLIYRAEKRAAASHGSSGASYGSTGASYGSTGASHGSYGSTGISSGSSGSTGHVPNRVLRKAARQASEGSTGSTGSSGSHGSSSHGSASHGSSSYGGSASHGHSSYAAPSASYGVYYVANRSAVSYQVQAQPEVAYAYVVVQLPEDAVLYLGGNKTTMTGGLRKFKIPVTDSSRSYPYAIRAELVRNGQTFVAASTETLVAGQTVSVKVNDTDVAVASR